MAGGGVSASGLANINPMEAHKTHNNSPKGGTCVNTPTSGVGGGVSIDYNDVIYKHDISFIAIYYSTHVMFILFISAH